MSRHVNVARIVEKFSTAKNSSDWGEVVFRWRYGVEVMDTANNKVQLNNIFVVINCLVSGVTRYKANKTIFRVLF